MGLDPGLGGVGAGGQTASIKDKQRSIRYVLCTTMVVNCFITRELILSSSFESFCLVINMFGNYN